MLWLAFAKIVLDLDPVSPGSQPHTQATPAPVRGHHVAAATAAPGARAGAAQHLTVELPPVGWRVPIQPGGTATVGLTSKPGYQDGNVYGVNRR